MKVHHFEFIISFFYLVTFSWLITLKSFPSRHYTHEKLIEKRIALNSFKHHHQHHQQKHLLKQHHHHCNKSLLPPQKLFEILTYTVLRQKCGNVEIRKWNEKE